VRIVLKLVDPARIQIRDSEQAVSRGDPATVFAAIFFSFFVTL